MATSLQNIYTSVVNFIYVRRPVESLLYIRQSTNIGLPDQGIEKKYESLFHEAGKIDISTFCFE